MTFSHTVATRAPAERIWAVWTDVANWPHWDTELVSASLTGPFEQGAKGTLKPRGAPVSGFVLSEVTPGRSYTFTTTLPLGKLYVRRYLTDSPTLAFTHEVRFTGPLAPVFEVVLGARYRKALPEVMQRLRACRGDGLSAVQTRCETHPAP